MVRRTLPPPPPPSILDMHECHAAILRQSLVLISKYEKFAEYNTPIMVAGDTWP